MSTNSVAYANPVKLSEYQARGVGNVNMKFDLARQVMTAHLSEFSVGTTKKARRHGPRAHVIILFGEGYSVLWPEGKEFKRVDW